MKYETSDIFIRRLARPHSSPLPRTRARPLARPSRASGSAEFLSLLSQAAIVSLLRRVPRWDAQAHFGRHPSVCATLVHGFKARTSVPGNLSLRGEGRYEGESNPCASGRQLPVLGELEKRLAQASFFSAASSQAAYFFSNSLYTLAAFGFGLISLLATGLVQPATSFDQSEFLPEATAQP